MFVVSKMKYFTTMTFSTFSIHPTKPTASIFFSSPSKSTLFDSKPFLTLRFLALQTPRFSSLKTSVAFFLNQTLQMGACRPPLSGEIHVIVGPMFAGKTTTLIRRIQSECSSGRFQVRPKMPFYPLDKTLKNLCFSGRLTEAIEHLWLAHVQVDAGTYALLLQECIFSKKYMKGKRIHAQMIIVGYVPTEYLKTKLLILYAKLGDLETAQFLFNKLQEKSLISWNAMIAGYVQKGLEEVGLSIYFELRENGFTPDQYTLVSVFKACAALALLEHGKRAHCVWINCQVGENVVVNSALVDMYFKCSSLCDGHKVFDESVYRNVISWTSLISGYGLHGNYEEVLVFFNCMKKEGVRPNNVTFLAVLSACSYGGLVKEGKDYFSSMIRDYGIQPGKQHYAAMVDLLGRAGQLKEAFEVVMNSPFRKHPVIWGALLGACRIHGNIDLMNFAAKKFFELDPQNVGKYVVVSNAYASSGLWDRAADIRAGLNELGMIKEPGYSRIEVHNEVHFFLRGDRSHKRSFEIYKILKEITFIIRNAGYIPEMSHT